MVVSFGLGEAKLIENLIQQERRRKYDLCEI